MTNDKPPQCFPAFEVHATVGEPQSFEIGGVLRRFIPILGGTFQGSGLKGTILSGGADWQIIRPDGTTELDARYHLKTDDGAIIQVENRGLRRGPAEIMQKLATGEPVEPSSYYFRTAAFFHTASETCRWLTESVFVGEAERYPDYVVVRFWRVE